MSEAVIKCDGVYKIFGENAKKMLQDSNGNVDAKTFQENGCIVGVNNASFEVEKGEMLVVMGLSGSGKSTLLRCISRLTDATGGKIFIEGQDLLNLMRAIKKKPELSQRELAKDLGFSLGKLNYCLKALKNKWEYTLFIVSFELLLKTID